MGAEKRVNSNISDLAGLPRKGQRVVGLLESRRGKLNIGI